MKDTYTLSSNRPQIISQLTDTDVTRSFTPIPKSFMPHSEHHADQRPRLYFLVKSYISGHLSPYITNSTPLPTDLVVSCAKGNFCISTLVKHNRIAMLAAGSGLTPMLPIIEFLLQRRGHHLYVYQFAMFTAQSE